MVTLPAKVLDLTREQDDKGYLTLSWRAPELNMAGGPLRELSHFEIWEASYPLEDFCEGCPSNYKKAGELALRPAPPGLRFSPKPYFWSEKLRENMVYRLRVAGFSGRGGVHPQAWTELTVYSLTPPGVLLGLKAEEDDLSVRISFERPEPWERAEIWRRAGSGPWEALILTQDNEYLDLSVSYGNTYAYRGRKTIPRGESLVPGPYSEVILVSVEDRVPLRPIAYLDASISPEGALLNWESMADDPQFKGYRLYRRLGPDDKFKALGGLLSQNSYLDKDAPPDREVRYIVTSVDNSPAANESLPSREAFLFTEEAPQPLPRPEL
jgi:hypothetical protein